MSLVELSRTAAQMQAAMMARYFEREFAGLFLNEPQAGDFSPWPRIFLPPPARSLVRHGRYRYRRADRRDW